MKPPFFFTLFFYFFHLTVVLWDLFRLVTMEESPTDQEERRKERNGVCGPKVLTGEEVSMVVNLKGIHSANRHLLLYRRGSLGER